MPFQPLVIAFQDQSTSTPAPAANGFLDWIWAAAERPGVVETLVAAIVVGLFVATWLRTRRTLLRLQGRKLLHDYLLGVEQAVHGDLDGAHERLQRVLAADPENHYARLLLGRVLRERGEPAEAHKHHLVLQQAFAVESAHNACELAHALLACDRPVEAAEAAESVLRELPQHEEALEIAFRARLRAGDPEAAAELAPRLLSRPRSATFATRLRAEVAAALTEAGHVRLLRGDAALARRLLDKARTLHPEAPDVKLLAVRLEAAADGAGPTAQKLLAYDATNAALPVAARAADPLPSRLPALRALAELLPEGRWRCGACNAPLTSSGGRCPRCHAEGKAEAYEPKLFVGVDEPSHLADAVEANAAHVRRTVRAAIEPEAESDRATARGEVLELGIRAVAELLAEAVAHPSGRGLRAIALLQAMGPATAPALFAAAEHMEDKRILPDGGAIANAVGRVVQGFDRTALPHVEALFASARPSSRNILIDYFVGLADAEAFQVVLERFPPLEILHRLNRIDRDVLRRFLQAMPKEGFVLRVLLLEPGFERDEELLRAVPGARDPEALERVLQQRGPSRGLVAELVRDLDDTSLRPVAERVLRAFGPQVLDALLSAFVDRDRAQSVRFLLGEMLAGLGAPAVERLCASFGPEPAALDDDLRSVLVRMGDEVVPFLRSEYERPSWLERWSVGFFGRSTNRRDQIARTLLELGTARAAAALQDLREQESDPHLVLRLEQALHAVRSKSIPRDGGRDDERR